MRKYLQKIIPSLTLIPLFIFTFWIYYQHIGSYAFVDEFHNFITAHFMLKGKLLYKDIFSNRQMLMSYLSYIIQLVSRPESLYKLILYHRLFVILFSFSGAVLLSIRFGWISLGFVGFYEVLKYYSFGNFFQAEALIVYPVVYLFALCWEKLNAKTLSKFDYIFSSFATWFVIFSREVYIPLALFLYWVIISGKKNVNVKKLSGLIFVLLSAAILSTVSLPSYLFQLFNVNVSTIAAEEVGGNIALNLLNSFFYPVLILFSRNFSQFHIILILLDMLFLLGVILLIKKREFKLLILLFITLGLAAIRPVSPGTEFFAAYRMLPWNGIFLISLCLILKETRRADEKLFKFSVAYLIVVFSFIIFSPNSYILKKVDKIKEFDISYNRHYVNGEIVRLLAGPGDKLFVDGYDSLIFWQADLDSSYRYTFYYPVLKSVRLFSDERIKMFDKNPPEFYFRDCIGHKYLRLPGFAEAEYKEFSSNERGSCLYIRKSKLDSLDKSELDSIKKFNYSI